KANVGHLDTVSGLAGLIKAALVLSKGVLPPQIHFDQPNPKIQLDDSPCYVNVESLSFEAKGKYAGVTALGIGGTNAHVVLRQHEECAVAPMGGDGVVCLSAPTTSALAVLKKLYLKSKGNAEDLFNTSVHGRTHFAHRAVLPVREGRVTEGGRQLQSSSRPIVFLFPGQGSQHCDMGVALHQDSSLFRSTLDGYMRRLESVAGRSFQDLGPLLYQTEYAQPLLLAFEVALASYLMQLGLQPKALLGHSLGEYTALVVSEALDFESCCHLVVSRAQLMSKIGPGSMLSVMASRGEVEALLPAGLDIAANNAPSLTTVSGGCAEVDAFAQTCQDQGLIVQKLRTENAYHSRHVEPILEAFRDVLLPIRFQAPRIPIISNLDGKVQTLDRLSNPQYWVDHMRHPVDFCSSVDYVYKLLTPLFLEVGPGKGLTTLVGQITSETGSAVNCLPHPKEKGSEKVAIQQALGACWVQGHEVKWDKAFTRSQVPRKAKLPLYPFESKECWTELSAPIKKTAPKALTYRRYWRQDPSLIQRSDDSRWVIIVGDANQAEQLLAARADSLLITGDE
ncbi:MAG: type I polyketide synthase, partial [Chlamydiia bacterium]|nr:type I polyketide synthase [Chlamydiia bacterium]